MSTITTKDGTEIYYKDWGEGPAVTFSHGWPLNSDMWDGLMLFLVQNGFRTIAHDRRGHGRSSQASTGNDMNGYADDLAAVFSMMGGTAAIRTALATRLVPWRPMYRATSPPPVEWPTRVTSLRSRASIRAARSSA